MSCIAIVFPSFGPYHRARTDALHDYLSAHGHRLIAFQFSRTSNEYSWINASPLCTKLITLDFGLSFFHSLLFPFVFASYVLRYRIRAVFVPSYSPLPNTAILIVSRLLSCKVVLMLDSWELTGAKNTLFCWVKRILVNLAHSAFVSGSKTKEYLVSLGFDCGSIYIGYDVVDNDYFFSFGKLYSSDKPFISPALPSQYFLSIGRLVPKKNIHLILHAYHYFTKHYVQMLEPLRFEDPSSTPTSSKTPSLVIVGNGPEFSSLIDQCNRLGLSTYINSSNSELTQRYDVVFYPFQEYDIVPNFYHNALCSILASNAEEWGLVVNESMACATPVICSDGIGSAYDLIQDGHNGFIFKSGDYEALSLCLFRSLEVSSDLSFKNNIQETIKHWDLSLFCKSAYLSFLHASSQKRQ